MFENIAEWVEGIFSEIVEFLLDLPLRILDSILSAIATVIESIPAPDVVESNIANYIPDDIAWFLVMSNFPEGLAIIGSAYLFYFLRRVLTLGIW